MLTSIHLRDFKSFESEELTLGPVTVLVGTNASGKSNVRDALRFFHGIAQGFSLAETLGRKWGKSGTPQWSGIRGGPREAPRHGTREFTLSATLGEPPEGRLEYRITARVDNGSSGPWVACESLYRSGDCVYDSHPKTDPVRGPEDGRALWVRGPVGGRYATSGPVLQLDAGRAALVQAADHRKMNQAGRDAIRQVLEAFRSMRFIDLSPEAMRQASQPGPAVLGDRGENLSSVLLRICEDEQQKEILLDWVRALTPSDVSDLRFPEDFGGNVLVHLVDDGGAVVSAHSASDGTLRFLGMVATLLHAEPGSFFFFEEIDNGIHPTRLHLLTDLLQRVSRHDSVQVVTTTHNPYLLTFLDGTSLDDAVLVYRREGSPESRVTRIVDIPEARRVIETRNLSHLHATGWLENAVELAGEEAA